ncbi:hypothetical protein AQF52_7305 [Streptomyces venezuelae]|nr:hypothetical protein AQF52_7305 [Streptomyces venezuelae]
MARDDLDFRSLMLLPVIAAGRSSARSPRPSTDMRRMAPGGRLEVYDPPDGDASAARPDERRSLSMTTHATAPGRRADTHSGGWMVGAVAIMIFSFHVAPRPVRA